MSLGEAFLLIVIVSSSVDMSRLYEKGFLEGSQKLSEYCIFLLDFVGQESIVVVKVGRDRDTVVA